MTDATTTDSDGNAILGYLDNQCDAGNYCVAGTIHQRPCSIGYFLADPGTATDGACDACTAGNYCPEEGMSAIGGGCAAGYICERGSYLEKPAIEVDDAYNPAVVNTNGEDPAHSYGICPRGAYCEAGATEGTDCVAGEYQNSLGAETQSMCMTCPRGQYCSTDG
jgi:hypothetical protein